MTNDPANPQSQKSNQQNDQNQIKTENLSLEDKIKALQDKENDKKEEFQKTKENEAPTQNVSTDQNQTQQAKQDPKDELIAKLQKELEDMKNIAIKATADYQNLKRRSEEDRIDAVKYGNAKLILEILPFIDNIKRSINHMPEDLKVNEWAQGMINIGKHILDSLNKQGLSKIETIGLKFDPNFHEALMSMLGEKDKIIQELEEGYTLNGRVIKPAKVIVGNGEEAKKNEIQNQK
jgi:molecular chaperone GrpE